MWVDIAVLENVVRKRIDIFKKYVTIIVIRYVIAGTQISGPLFRVAKEVNRTRRKYRAREPALPFPRVFISIRKTFRVQ
jgi:hypothetical protein